MTTIPEAVLPVFREERPGELRFTAPPYTTAIPHRLQQKWHITEYESDGLVRHFFEWRDVPTVVVDP